MIVDEVKSLVKKTIDDEAQELNDLSQEIWKNPELDFEEKHAHEFLTNFLEKKGFKIQRNFHLATAFRAEFSAPGGADGVTVCIIVEYDALPEIGHACGHNLISEAGIGAGLGVKAAMEANKNIKGKVVVMGTPAEEGGGGKILLIKAGAFEDIDFAMMAHPTIEDILDEKALAKEEIKVQFFGKEAHASAVPWEGINALDAVMACYMNISLFRQHMQPTWRVHGIVTKGGVKANIIPRETEMEFQIRAPTRLEVEALKKAVIDCFEAAAQSTGCTINYTFKENSNYDSMLGNEPMLQAYKKYGEEDDIVFIEVISAGSTDMGNVSHIVPSIHPYFAIPSEGVNHTKDFADAAGAPEAQLATLRASHFLALTAVQLLTDKVLQEESHKAFANALT